MDSAALVSELAAHLAGLVSGGNIMETQQANVANGERLKRARAEGKDGK